MQTYIINCFIFIESQRGLNTAFDSFIDNKIIEMMRNNL